MTENSGVIDYSEIVNKLVDLKVICKKCDRKTLEDLCQFAISYQNGKEENRKEPELLSTLMLNNGVAPLDVNFNIRFSKPWVPNESKKKASFIFGLGALAPSDYENVTSEAILNAPITDICIVQRNEPTPTNFYRISRTPSNKRADLNTGSGGSHLYLCIRKSVEEDVAPITALVIVYPDKNEYVPPGFSVVKRGNIPCNINNGTNAERIYLCYKRDPTGNPITDIQIFFPTKGESLPTDFDKIERSVRFHPADLNMGTSAQTIALCYKQNLRNLECLVTKADSLTTLNLNAKRYRRFSSYTGLAPVMEALMEQPPSPEEKITPEAKRKDDYANARRLSNISSLDLNEDWEYVPRDNDAIKENDNDTESVHNTDGAVEDIKEAETPDDDKSEVLSTTSEVNVDQSGGGINFKNEKLVTPKDEPVPAIKRVILHAVLGALFSRGDIFEIALSIFTYLVDETKFFDEEYIGRPLSGGMTILDLSINTLAERLDYSVEQINNKILLTLITMVKKSKGNLSKVSTQKLFVASAFVSSAIATRSNWIPAGYDIPVQDDGRDMPAFILINELISQVCSLCELSGVEHNLPEINLDPNSPFSNCYHLDHLLSQGESSVLVCEIVTAMIDDVMDTLETSKITEVSLLTVSKKSSSMNTQNFWVHLNSIAKQLFVSYDVQTSFMLLGGLCKYSWLPMKSAETGESLPRHLGTKLVGIECLRKFCKSCGPKLRISKIMGYQVRRLVISCISDNMKYALVVPRIFSKLLKLMTTLWRNWREHIRIEFPLLCEQLIIKVLQAPNTKIDPIYQYIALMEIMKWFEQPHMLVEMYVNFDMDGVVVSGWNIFSHIIRAVCSLAEKSSRPIKENDSAIGPFPAEGIATLEGNVNLFGTNAIRITPRDVKIKALDVTAQITRAMMDATGHANLIIQDLNTRKKSTKGVGWIESGNSEDLTASDAIGVLTKTNSTIKSRREIALKDQNLLKNAVKIYHEKDSLSKAVKYLISHEFIPNNPQAITSFIRLYKNEFDPAAIGDYLGEGGRTPDEEKYWTNMRYHYTRAVSFVDMDVEQALRLYLTGCGFRMPGEGQKIDRFITAFVTVYWQDNRHTEFCPFQHEDTVHLLAFAVIMLNTDLHRANMDKKKNAKKMTKEAFIKNLRGADQGSDIDPNYLGRIYDNIAATPIEMAVDKAKEESPREADTKADLKTAFIQDLLKNLRSSEDLLRSLSPHVNRFFVMGVDISISLELVSIMFESVWHNFHAISDFLLLKMANEENVIFSALDVLSNSLSSCIFLDLKVEKTAFATQLARFRQICEQTESSERASSKIAFTGASFATGNFRYAKWFESVERSTAETAITAIAEVHGMIHQLKDVIRVCARREATKAVFARIEKKANIADPNRFVLLEGDLKKRSKAGKYVLYRFFLFSDMLVYAHFGFSEYKVHEQLELDTAEVSSVVEHDPTNCQFWFKHPTKSFVLLAESQAEKHLWTRTLTEAINACVLRKHGKRLDIFDRMQSQEIQVNERQAIHETYSANNRLSLNLSTPDRPLSKKSEVSTPKAQSINGDQSPNGDDAASRQVTFDTNKNENIEIEQRSPLNGGTFLSPISETHHLSSSPSSQGETDLDAEYYNASGIPIELKNRGASISSDEDGGTGHLKDPMIAFQTTSFCPKLESLDSEDEEVCSINSSTRYEEEERMDQIINEEKALTPIQDLLSDERSATRDFSVFLSDLDPAGLTKVFNSALRFWKTLLDDDDPASEMPDNAKFMLYGLYKQARCGPAPPDTFESPDKNAIHDATLESKIHDAQLKSWRASSHLSKDDAIKYFLVTLHSVCPNWNYRQE